MALDRNAAKQRIKAFDFGGLFTQELGWDHHKGALTLHLPDRDVPLYAVAEKRGFAVWQCPTPAGDNLPDSAVRRRIERELTKAAHEHILIFTDGAKSMQVWQWVRREAGKPTRVRETVWTKDQSGELLVQKLEFPAILRGGGFDVIIGNPPYVELKDVDHYIVRGYATLECGDLYTLCLERSVELAGRSSALGFIVPLSAYSVAGFKSFQDFYVTQNEKLWVSHWSGDAHPAKLFEGVDKRLQIVLSRRNRNPKCEVFTSRYLKWYTDERPSLFQRAPTYLGIASLEETQFFRASMPKIHTGIESRILNKLRAQSLTIEALASRGGQYRLYYTRKVSFFLQFLDFVPEIKDNRGRTIEPSELKVLYFSSRERRDAALACLSSSLFYWFNVVNSDCRNLNKREVSGFRIPNIPPGDAETFRDVLSRLMASYKKNSTHRTVFYKRVGNITVQYFNFRPSKGIIDELDVILARHYAFTNEELDFLVNYDIKYRLGRESGEEE